MGEEKLKTREIEINYILDEIEKDFDKIFSSFSKLKLAVFGDVMLDEYLIGDTERISPEAPVPVVNISKEYSIPGGAGNTAANIKKIGGGYVKLFSVVGDDAEGRKLKSLLDEREVSHFLAVDRNRPTTSKTRVIARGQHVVRIDREVSTPLSKDIVDMIKSEFRKEKFDVVVFSDYAKGFFTEEIKDIVGENFCVCDPKPKNIFLFKGVDVVLPNRKEAFEIYEILGKGELILMDEKEKKSAIPQIAKRISDFFGISKVIITQGEDGMTIYHNSEAFHIPAFARDVFDVTGAGDTVTAVFSLCEGAKIPLEIASVLASLAASVKVSHLGTYTPSKAEILKALKIVKDQIKNSM